MKIIVDFKESSGNTFEADFGQITRVAATGAYTGQYEITPNPDEAIILPTKDKMMTKNLTVFKIPYWETSNPVGTTVYIGTENVI